MDKFIEEIILNRIIGTVILAAGKGTRMNSSRAKVLFELGEKPLIKHVVDTSQKVQSDRIVVVVGYRKDDVTASLEDYEGLRFVEQKTQNGTGHAVMMAKDEFNDAEGDVFILCGDVPLLKAETLASLLKQHRETEAACTVLTAVLDDPARYGRIVRDENGNVHSIVEYKDATDEQRKICEINTGIYCFDIRLLFEALSKVGNTNQQNEYYLTDTLEILRTEGNKVCSMILDDMMECAGVNSQKQLAELEDHYYEEIRDHWMTHGVTIKNPQTVTIGDNVQIENDVEIGSGTVIKGKTLIGSGCRIGPGCILHDARLGANCVLPGLNVVINTYMSPDTKLDYSEDFR